MGIRTWLYRRAIAVAMKRRAPNRIPLSAPRALNNNFFLIELVDRDSNQTAVIDNLAEQGAEALYFNGGMEGGFLCVILNASLPTFDYVFTHYLWGYIFTYRTPLEFQWKQAVGQPFLSILHNKLQQARFNRRPLVRRERIEILRHFIIKTEQRHDFRTSAADLIHQIHTSRSFSHPQRAGLLQYYQLMLESLTDAGYLRESDGGFRLHPHGITGLSEYELEERRHNDNRRQQRMIGWLTVALALIGTVQAYVTYMTIPAP